MKQHLTCDICFRYGRRSNWFKIHCLLDDSGSPPPGTPTDLGSEAGSWGRGASEDESDTIIDVCGTGVPQHSPHRTSPALSSPDSHASDTSIEAAPRRPPALGYFSLYPKNSVVPPSSGIYSGASLNPLLLSRLPMAVSAYTNHPFDPYLQQTLEAAQPQLQEYYEGAYSSHNTPAFRGSPVNIPPSGNTRSPQSPTRSLSFPSKRLAEDLPVLPPIKRIRQMAGKEPKIFSSPLVFTSTIKTPEKISSLKNMCRSPVEHRPSAGEKRPSSTSETDRDGDSPMDLSVKTGDPVSHRHWVEERSDTEDSVILDLSLKSRLADRKGTIASHEAINKIHWDGPTQGGDTRGIVQPTTGKEYTSKSFFSTREEAASSPSDVNGNNSNNISYNSSCCKSNCNSSSTSLLYPI